jgi:hypothetical protein
MGERIAGWQALKVAERLRFIPCDLDGDRSHESSSLCAYRSLASRAASRYYASADWLEIGV